MNERIRKLAVQSHAKGNTLHYYNPEFIEKFAELIVRECISALDQDDGATHHSELLLEHFGVSMSTEDKKTLIKELLGVKNETN